MTQQIRCQRFKGKPSATQQEQDRRWYTLPPTVVCKRLYTHVCHPMCRESWRAGHKRPDTHVCHPTSKALSTAGRRHPDITACHPTYRAPSTAGLSETFEIGKESRLIELKDWNIGFYDNIDNRIIRNYLSELDDYKKKKDKERKEDIIKTLGKDFYDCYSNNLSQLDLVRRNEAVEYVNSREYKSPIQEHFYKSSIENFDKDNLRITSVDDRGRIYHYLTNCPRVLRKYFNIRFDVDIANSQPLLFCNFLIETYNIDYEIIDYIRNIDNSLLNSNIQDNNYIYNKGKQLSKLLKDSNLRVHNLNDIPSDVLLYLYSCMKGLFWDDFVMTFAELERGEVKENLFREVFYSHSRTMKYKEYGKVFAEVYPSVWHLIREMKKNAELLCNRITEVESEIFHAILVQCFQKGWVVTSVHDAVYVLDVPGNEGIDEGELIEIIMSEYRKHRLIPTVHLEKS